MRREKKKKFLPGAPLRIMVGLVLAIGIGTLIYNGFYRVNEPVGSIPVPTPAGEEITNTPEPNEAPETNETEGVIDMEFVVEVPAERIGELADARVTFQGISRVFTYYVPSNFTPGDTLPLMITLHGRAFNAESQLLESQFHELA
ncbi:MAG: hypothetical protein FWC72_01950, partial [Oscillospiraceae bacterium]|nr:hypothetical protein [Oscillospiraceae bacterium]